MIVAAGLLVLVGAGLFVAGLLTEVTALYWACVAACVVAAVLLYLARRQLAASATAAAPAAAPASSPVAAAAAPGAGRHTDSGAVPATASSTTVAPRADGPPPAHAGAPVTAVPAAGPAAADPGDAPTPVGATAVGATATAQPSWSGEPGEGGEPPVEEVEVTDLLLVVDLRDEVLVVDEHPRYHLAGCRHLDGEQTIPIPLDEAKTDGFTPCGSCRPDATLADRVRARK